MRNSQKKLPVGDGDDPGPQLLGQIDIWHIALINLGNRNPVIAYNHVISNRQLITTHA
jgi:hypothetical protein